MQSGAATTNNKQQGFVLILVLAALVLLSLLAVRLDSAAITMREEAQFRLDLQRHHTKARGVLDRVLWQMMTQPLQIRSFGQGDQELLIDGTPYRVNDNFYVSVQNTRGLINLNFFSRDALKRLLRAQDVPDEAHDQLIDVLLDYADTDDLKRLNGAETNDFIDAGLPLPRNDWLMHPREVSNMVHWREYPDLISAVGEYATTHSDGSINVNTAPPEVLALLPGAGPNVVERILTLRQQQPFIRPARFAAETGLEATEEQFFPGLFYRVRIWSRQGFPALEYIVMLTPNYADRPYQILDTRYVEQPTLDVSNEKEDDIAAFPNPVSEGDLEQDFQ